MKNIIKISLLLIGLLLVSCDDYLDVNKPADAVELDQLAMKDIIAPVMHSTVYADYSAATYLGNYTQYFGSYGSGAAGQARLGSTWNDIYLYNIPNLKTVKGIAEKNNAKHYGAVADILTAINIGLATDLWDNVPYSEASQPSVYPFPKFDTQEKIYSDLMSLLNSAIASLESSDDSGYKIGSEDLIYRGNTDKWLRAAYTLKARYQLRLLKKDLVTPAEVLATINKGFTSNEDDFQLNYPEEEINPWYRINITSRSTGNFYRAPNDQLISLMNGTTYPFSTIDLDPRLQEIFTNEGSDGDPWRGFMNGGDGESSDGEPANTYYKKDGFYTSANTPLFLITYAEAMFIKAEVSFLANGGTETSTGSTNESYNAYLEGIQANMSKLGVNSSAYLADASIAVGEANLMLNHIMKEKYIANIHSTETFTDFRRYDFSSNVFKGLALRLETGVSDEDEMQGKWYRRAIYPISEKNNNEAIVNANWQEPDVSVWWAN